MNEPDLLESGEWTRDLARDVLIHTSGFEVSGYEFASKGWVEIEKQFKAYLKVSPQPASPRQIAEVEPQQTELF